MRKAEPIQSKAWSGQQPPQRVLLIRIEALGDAFATFPFASHLKRKIPELEIDLLIREDYAPLAREIGLFRKVITLPQLDSRMQKLKSLSTILPALRKHKYELILDMQRNVFSRWLRFLLHPEAYAEFDRYSPRSALKRYQWSFEQSGLGKMQEDYSFAHRYLTSEKAQIYLNRYPQLKENSVIILNPAGAFPTRNWPIEYYINFMQLWNEKAPKALFLLLGVEKIRDKAAFLEAAFPGQVINLVGQTTIPEAYTWVLRADFMLSEDSGLGHFSWISGKKTLMLLGSTRADWTRPYGDHTDAFDSSDLPCGNCMRAKCLYPEITCMTRLEAKMVFDKAWLLYQK